MQCRTRDVYGCIRSPPPRGNLLHGDCSCWGNKGYGTHSIGGPYWSTPFGCMYGGYVNIGHSIRDSYISPARRVLDQSAAKGRVRCSKEPENVAGDETMFITTLSISSTQLCWCDMRGHVAPCKGPRHINMVKCVFLHWAFIFSGGDNTCIAV